ncbi:hypothetical protein Tco_1099710 [Tanacetum coccineum]
MLADELLHHEVEGRVDRLVEELEELVSNVAEEVVEVTEQIETLTKSPTFPLNQGINGSRNENAVGDSIHEDVRNVNMSNDRSGCSYKEFVACKLKEFNSMGGVIAYTRWVEKMEATRGREAAVGMTWEDFKPLMKEEYCPSNEMQNLEIEFWSYAMVGAGHVAYTD